MAKSPDPSAGAGSNPGQLTSGEDLLAKPPEYSFAVNDYSPAELCEAIRAVPVAPDEEKLSRVAVTGASGQHHLLMNLNHPVRIDVDGPLGDYACALTSRSDIRITGPAGHGVAEGMTGGSVRVRGDAGVGAGAGMSGGTLAIYGAAGDRCGAGMRGGGIFVRGDVGDEAGVGALRGTIVIGGDAGNNVGDAMSNVTVFIRGRATSLAQGVTEAPLRKRELLRLGLLLINASIRGEAKDFRRIIPEAMLRAEQSQRGELNPHWR